MRRMAAALLLAGCVSPAALLRDPQPRTFELLADDCAAADSMGRVTLSADGRGLNFAQLRCTANPPIAGTVATLLDCTSDAGKRQRKVTARLAADALTLSDGRGTTVYAACPAPR